MYEGLLSSALRHQFVVSIGALLFLVIGGWVGLEVHREVVPRTNQGRLNIHMALPADADLALVSDRARIYEEAVLEAASFEHMLADIGERDESRLQIDPRPPYEADLLTVMAPEVDLDEAIREINAIPVPADVQVEVAAERTQLESLLELEFVDGDWDTVGGLIFNVLGHVPEVGETVDSNGVQLRVERMEGRLSEPVPTRGRLMPLSTFLAAEYVLLPASLMRGDQIPILRILADVSQESDLDDATRAIEAALDPVLPSDVRLRIGGANEAFRNSLRAVGISFLLSILLVYLILAAQFESLVQPLVILMTVPLALAGVALILLVTGQTVNLMSLTGCVVLIGIVVNDAIVKVDFINQRRATGVALIPAIMDAGRDRLRPIIMTTVTTAFGLLPLALGIGPGA
ncbi:MAG: efflux RND transporter permease subunit, partial [Bacteroidetes bacterium]|nr:efflux RND transporter permease subunit [Bacteroidota bacterium]